MHRCYHIVLLLALLAGPQAVQLWHELGDAHTLHCNAKELHYCAEEHNCALCAVLRSNPATLPVLPFAPCTCLVFTDLYRFTGAPTLPAMERVHLLPRGPPLG